MLRRGIISTEDTIAQNGNINVTGRARNRLPLSREHIFVNDSINVDQFFENLGKLAY